MFKRIRHWWQRQCDDLPPVLILVQARMESTRFPGKVLAPCAGRPLLWWQLRRLQRVRPPQETYILAPDTPGSWEGLKLFYLSIREELNVHLCVVAHGDMGDPLPPEDVLGRYAQAVMRLAHNYEWIVRQTGDCPLVDPAVIDAVILGTIRSGAVYGALAAEWPDGLDIEVIRKDVLLEAHAEATSASDREHVTPWLWRQPERYKPFLLPCSQDLSQHCWSVDRYHDLYHVDRILTALGERVWWQEVTEWLYKDPEALAWATERPRNSAYLGQLRQEGSPAREDWNTQRYGEQQP